MKWPAILGAVVIVALLGGCPVSDQVQTEQDLDGRWQFMSLEGGTTCITIEGGRVVAWDGGCQGHFQQIVSSMPAAISSGRVTLQFTVHVVIEPVDFGEHMYTLDVEFQEDGSLRGPFSVWTLWAGQVQGEAVLVRR